MTPPEFYQYGQDIPANRTVTFRKPKIIPVQMIPQLHQIGINSTSGFYEFVTKNSNGLSTIQQLSGLYEDDAARLLEKTTRTLEKLGMIDTRCGPKSDPCKTLPKYILK